MNNFSRRQVVYAAGIGFAVFGGPAVAKARKIDESGFVQIGGIDQWVSVRGDDVRNPILLVVHGGPGEAQWPASPEYLPWEAAFTVVQWDQRGAGHTFSRYGTETPDVTLDRIVRDGLEVAENLRQRLGKKKLIVLGHSWGSIVAINMVERRPDLFAAYVGTGQAASWKAVVQAQFDFLLARARQQGDAPTVKMLEDIGHPDPANLGQYFQFARGLSAAMPAPDREWIRRLRAMTPESLDVPPKDLHDLYAGEAFSAARVLPEMIKTDLPATASKILTAFFVIQGRDDITAPTEAAVAYFQAVSAPVKRLILIDGAGHFAFLTHTKQFLAALTSAVRPVAISQGA